MSRRLCIGATAVLVGIAALFQGCKSEPKAVAPSGDEDASASAQAATGLAAPVRIAYVDVADVPVYLDAIGTVMAWASIDIRPQVNGRVTAIYVDGGQMVTHGDLLFSIDPVPYQAVLNKAKAALEKDEAQLRFAQQTYDRFAAVGKQNFVTQVNVDQYQQNVDIAKAQVAMDKADIEAAQIDLDNCTVYSPLSGRVGLLRVNVGDVITTGPNTVLTNIQQLSPIAVQFSLSQGAFRDLQSRQGYGGIRCEVFFDEGQGDSVIADLYFIDNHIDTSTGTILLKCRALNTDEKLWPGEFVRVRLMAWTRPQALLVPQSAVHKGQRGSFVYRVNADKVVEVVAVTVREKLGDRVAVEGPLQPGDAVVTDGHMNVRPGAKVSWTENSPQDSTEETEP